MAASGLEVLQGVLVLGVSVAGKDLLVDVYGSTSHVCGSVRFTVPGRLVRRRPAALLRRWAEEGRPLTLVQNRARVSLQDDAAVYGTRLGAGR